MSTNFWQTILNGLKALINNIELELSKAVKLFGDVINQILTAEEHQLMADAKPIVQQIAINLQNEMPGLSAQEFIAALIQASVLPLKAEGIRLADTALGILSSTVAHELAVPDAAGNAGTVSA